MLARALPGLAPNHVRITATRQANGYYTVTVLGCDGPGFATAADQEVYEALTAEEALDVVGASLGVLLDWR